MARKIPVIDWRVDAFEFEEGLQALPSLELDKQHVSSSASGDNYNSYTTSALCLRHAKWLIALEISYSLSKTSWEYLIDIPG